MEKTILFLFAILLTGVGGIITAHSSEGLQLDIKEYRLVEEGLLIRYSVINERNFDRNNVIIAFKVLSEGKPLACKEIRASIPRGADGSKVEEVILDLQNGGKSFKLVSSIFQDIPRYKVEEWFSGCP